MPEDILLFLTKRTKKMAVWKTTFVSEHLNADQSQLSKCFSLHSLHALPVVAWRFQLTALAGETMQRAQNT